jgi:hypothetical protein
MGRMVSFFRASFFAPRLAMSGVPTEQPNKSKQELRRSGKLPALSKRTLILLIAVVCVVLLISLFGERITYSFCREAHRVVPFRGPFSALCGRIFIRDLFLDGTAGFAI